jgi:hypothetical protein
LIWKLFGAIPVPGYAATVLLVSFFGALNCFGLGVIGGYVWRTFENTKFRPNFIVARHDVYDAKSHGGDFLSVTQAMPDEPRVS